MEGEKKEGENVNVRKKGRKEERKEGRKEGRERGRKETKKGGDKQSLICKQGCMNT